MVVTDRDGNLWIMANSARLLRYNPTTNVATYFATGVTTDLFETRLGYDELTHSIYFGGFAVANLYRFDITTSAVTAMLSHPEGALNDIFCSDHSGHIYAAGGFSGNTIWQFDILTNTWARIPDFTVDQGNNGSCGVAEEGYLYIETGNVGDLRRIPLL